MSHLATLVTSFEKQVVDQKLEYTQKVVDSEGNMRGLTDDVNLRAKGPNVELERKMGAVQGLLNDLEKALVARVDKIEIVLKAQKGQVDGHRIFRHLSTRPSRLKNTPS